jgi:formylglycine-generating enzyme required for sulfatase activity
MKTTQTIGIAMIVIVAAWWVPSAGAAETATEPATQPSPQPAKELTLDLGKKVTMKLVQIPAGKFLMGSPKDEKDRDREEVQHEVAIGNPFYMGVYTMTQAQWEEVMGTTVVQQRDKGDKSWKLYGQGANYPMYYVSREEATEFCKKLSEKTGKTVTLPTEAQWEYACRAGSTTRFGFGNDDAGLGNYAWYAKNSGGKTHPVGQKKPNKWGLYDMHGNVWQWCSDWHDKDVFRIFE